MKAIRLCEVPPELDGFIGGMGNNSIASINAYDLGFEIDITGYISAPVNGVYYAEVRDECGNNELTCGEIDELQKWITDTIYELAKEY